MAKPELTKNLIATSLKELLDKKSLDKISVREIIEQAKLNRQTFYYHFKDKQELICWIFDSDISKLRDVSQNNTLIDDVATYMYSEKRFYISALTSDAQNNLREHMYTVFYSALMSKSLALLNDRTINKDALYMFASYFTNAVVGSLVQWAQSGMPNEANPYQEAYATLTSDCLEFVINKYIKDN